MDLQQTPIRAKALNQMALLNLISGLVYEPKTDNYQFKNKKYKLREITSLNKAYNNHYFVNIVEPTEMVIVKCTNGRGLPIYDGFNNIKVDSRARHLQYLKSYYYDVRKPRTEAKHTTVKKCLQCGKEFTGTPRQKYCSDKCRIKFNSNLCTIRHKGNSNS